MNQTLTQILSPVWNDPTVPLNKYEIIREALANAGFENIDKFIQPPQQQPMPAGMAPQMPMQNVAGGNVGEYPGLNASAGFQA